MLERGVEVDVVRDLERQTERRPRRADARAVVRARGRDRLAPTPRGPCGQQRVQRRLREDVAEAREVDRLVAVPPERARSARARRSRHRIPSCSSSSTGSKNEQLPIEWSSEPRTSRELAGARAARSRQRNDVGVERERPAAARAAPPPRRRRRAAASRLRKPCSPALGRIRVVQPRRRLEDEPARAAAADEVGELLHRRHALAAAADLRAQPARRHLVERHALEVDRVVLPLASRALDDARASRASSCGSSASCAAGQTNRPSSHACSLARARRSSASASAGGMLAGGNIGAWSKSLVEQRAAGVVTARAEATLPPGQAPRSGSLRTASDPGGSSAKHSLPGVRSARPFEPVRHLLESSRGRALPEIPPAELRRGRRAGGGRPDAEQRDHVRTGAPGLSLRRPARHRQDVDGAHPREVPQLRAGPDDDARRHVPRLPRRSPPARRST